MKCQSISTFDNLFNSIHKVFSDYSAILYSASGQQNKNAEKLGFAKLNFFFLFKIIKYVRLSLSIPWWRPRSGLFK